MITRFTETADESTVNGLEGNVTGVSEPGHVWTSTSWFAVQTKPRREALAATSLRDGGVEVFLPKCRRHKESLRPLFPGYLFARLCPLKALDSVRYSPGVLRVLSSGSTPIPVPDESIAEFQEEMQAEGFILLKSGHLKPGDQVEVQEGPLRGFVGRVQRECDGGRRVMILLECLMHSRTVMETHCLARIAEAV